MDRSARGYAICATPRSGSSYFCRVLESTGVLGQPREYFNVAARRKNPNPDLPTGPLQLIDWIVTKSCTGNGVYGLKLFPDHVDRLAGVPWKDRLPALRFVYFTREDLLGQAISLLRAEQTDRWRSNEIDRREPRYDARGILRRMKKIAAAEARWRVYFARTGVEPLCLSYEALLRAPQGTVDQVKALMGAEQATIDLGKVGIGLQRDEESERWRTRFLVERGEANVVDGSGVAARLRRAGSAVRNRFSWH
jgi:LPS sulfotransferase NodH